MRRAVYLWASIVLISLALVPAVVAQEQPYGNESNSTGRTDWTENRTEPTIANTTHYVSRVTTFVVGTDPADPGVGPLIVGLLVGGVALTSLGQSQAGLIASGTIGVLTAAALAAPGGAGLLPKWLYGSVMMLVALVAGIVYIRVLR